MNLQEIEARIAKVAAEQDEIVNELAAHASDHQIQSAKHISEMKAAEALITKITGVSSVEDDGTAGPSFALTAKRKQITFNWRWAVLALSALIILYGATHHLL